MNITYSDIINTIILIITIIIGWESFQRNTKTLISGMSNFRIWFFVGLHAYIFVAYVIFFAGAGVLGLASLLAKQFDFAVSPAIFSTLAKRSIGLTGATMGIGVLYEKLARTKIKPFCIQFNSHKKDSFTWLDLIGVLWCAGVTYIFFQ